MEFGKGETASITAIIVPRTHIHKRREIGQPLGTVLREVNKLY